MKEFLAGLLTGYALFFLLKRGKLSRLESRKSAPGRVNMTASEAQVISRMRELLQERPEAAQPDQDFLRDWAFGNAGLEDERITIEQVNSVLAKRHHTA
jgi:hypothetical protein